MMVKLRSTADGGVGCYGGVRRGRTDSVSGMAIKCSRAGALMLVKVPSPSSLRSIALVARRIVSGLAGQVLLYDLRRALGHDPTPRTRDPPACCVRSTTAMRFSADVNGKRWSTVAVSRCTASFGAANVLSSTAVQPVSTEQKDCALCSRPSRSGNLCSSLRPSRQSFVCCRRSCYPDTARSGSQYRTRLVVRMVFRFAISAG